MERIGPDLFGCAHHYISIFWLDFEVLVGSTFGKHEPDYSGMSEATGPNETCPFLLVVF